MDNRNKFEKAVTFKHRNDFSKYIYSASKDLIRKSKKEKNNLRSVEAIINYKKKFKADFEKAICGISKEKLLNSECTGTINTKTFHIEKRILTGESGTCITSNVYVPNLIKEKIPAVLVLCGHCVEGKADLEYQRLCQRLVAEGMIVLIIDSMGQGERFDFYNPITKENKIGVTTSEHSYNGAKCWMIGKPLNHYFVRDIMLALDYLCSRPEVDKKNIGVTGHSGGGTQTALLMMCQDERIKAYAPATYITEYLDNLKTFIPQDDEQIFYGLLNNGFNYDNILLSVVPKPVMLLGVYHDFFPVDGLLKTYETSKKYYKLFKREDNLELTIDNSLHSYTYNLARSCAVFFKKHLLNDNSTLSDFKFEIIDKDKLNATNNGQISEYPSFISLNAQIIDEYKKIIKNRISDYNILLNNILNGKKIQEWKFEFDKIFYNQNNKISYYFAKVYNKQTNVFKVYENTKKQPVKTELWFLDNGTIFNDSQEKEIYDKVDKGLRIIVVDTCNFGLLKPMQKDCYDVYDRFGLLYTFSHQMFFMKESFASLRVCEIMSAIKTVKKYWHDDICIIAKGNIENLCAIACYFLNEKCKFCNESVTFDQYCNDQFPDDTNIKPYIIYGICKHCDIDAIKKLITTK